MYKIEVVPNYDTKKPYYNIINIQTFQVQSSWYCYSKAVQVAYDLNRKK